MFEKLFGKPAKEYPPDSDVALINDLKKSGSIASSAYVGYQFWEPPYPDKSYTIGKDIENGHEVTPHAVAITGVIYHPASTKIQELIIKDVNDNIGEQKRSEIRIDVEKDREMITRSYVPPDSENYEKMGVDPKSNTNFAAEHTQETDLKTVKYIRHHVRGGGDVSYGQSNVNVILLETRLGGDVDYY